MFTQQNLHTRRAAILFVASLVLLGLACGLPTTSPAVPPTSPPTVDPLEGIDWPGDLNNFVGLGVVNDLSGDICYFYVSPPGDDTWGVDWLGQSETIPPGASRTFDVPAGRYDLLAEDCDHEPVGEVRDFDLTVANRHTFSAPAPEQVGAPPAAAGCQPPAIPIRAGAGLSGHLDATNEPYPANCTYYCLRVPPGTGSLDVSLTDFDVDLDLFMGYGDITSVRGADPNATPWVSNEYGTGDEFISIPNPEADGAYYIEICSYEALESNFQVHVTVQ